MPYYSIVVTTIMLCTSYVPPEEITKMKFEAICETEWCVGNAFIDCLNTVKAIPDGFILFECMRRDK